MLQKIKRITPKNKHFFFGYYNMSPWNKEENKILANNPNFIDRHPTKEDKLPIGYFEGNKFIKIDKTPAWNWQQGCLMQWLPNSNDKIIYNSRKGNKFISIIYDIKRKKKKEICSPIYSIHSSGNYAISINFSRLNDIRRGYSYSGLNDKNAKVIKRILRELANKKKLKTLIWNMN